MSLDERAAKAIWDEENDGKTVAELRKELLDSEPRKFSLVDHIASGNRHRWAYLQYGAEVYRARVETVTRSEYDRKGGPGIGVLKREHAEGFHPHAVRGGWRKILGHEKFFELINRPHWIEEQQEKS